MMPSHNGTVKRPFAAESRLGIVLVHRFINGGAGLQLLKISKGKTSRLLCPIRPGLAGTLGILVGTLAPDCHPSDHFDSPLACGA